jgi:hypothetical protein
VAWLRVEDQPVLGSSGARLRIPMGGFSPFFTVAYFA